MCFSILFAHSGLRATTASEVFFSTWTAIVEQGQEFAFFIHIFPLFCKTCRWDKCPGKSDDNLGSSSNNQDDGFNLQHLVVKKEC